MKEQVGELHRVLDGKKNSLRKTHKNQAEANDEVWLSLLATYHE